MHTFRTLFLICCTYLISFAALKAQESEKLVSYNGKYDHLKGLWTGILYQKPDRKYYFEIHIEEITSEGKVKGITYIEARKELGSPGSDRQHGTILYTGQLVEENNQLYLDYREYEIEKQEIDTLWYWCIKGGKLNILQTNEKNDKNSQLYIRGNWSSHVSTTCQPGQIDVSKVGPKRDNSTIVKYMKKYKDHGVVADKELFVQTDSLIIEIWDDMVVDGDTVSLFMNGDWLLKNERLEARKKSIKAYNLQEVTTVILHAENLGSIPPNTAFISVYDGITRQEVKLSSNKNKSEAVLIYRKK